MDIRIGSIVKYTDKILSESFCRKEDSWYHCDLLVVVGFKYDKIGRMIGYSYRSCINPDLKGWNTLDNLEYSRKQESIFDEEEEKRGEPMKYAIGDLVEYDPVSRKEVIPHTIDRVVAREIREDGWSWYLVKTTKIGMVWFREDLIKFVSEESIFDEEERLC